jgi:hypothetical protein
MEQDQLVKDQRQVRARAWVVGRVRAGGLSGNCVSPNCGATVPNVARQLCNQRSCPKGGAKMIRS